MSKIAGNEIRPGAMIEHQGALWIAVCIAVSTLGFLSQSILTAPRVYYAMARDGLFFASVGRLSRRAKVPAVEQSSTITSCRTGRCASTAFTTSATVAASL